MQYVLTPYSDISPSYCFWEKGFSEEELDWLQDRATNSSERGIVNLEGSAEEHCDIRRSDLSWMYNEPETNWVYERIADIASSLNSKFYRFDLSGFGEAIQMTNYSSEEEGKYEWHQDCGAKISRKISLVLQLSNPDEYEGGELQIFNESQITTMKKDRGYLIAFPSYTMHQVTPVTSGNRQSLVTWLSGPAFR